MKKQVDVLYRLTGSYTRMELQSNKIRRNFVILTWVIFANIALLVFYMIGVISFYFLIAIS